VVDTCFGRVRGLFRSLVFPGIQQEVVLLLATRGEGPARIRTVEVDDARDLAGLDPPRRPPSAPACTNARKWTKYYLSADQIELIRGLRRTPGSAPGAVGVRGRRRRHRAERILLHDRG
jgi:hypothetical protein